MLLFEIRYLSILILGPFQNHFALTSHQTGFDAIRSMKFSLEYQNPLVTGEVSGSKTASKQNEFSLLSVSDPNVLLWSVKPSEEGMANGLITRFWNMGSSKSNPEIKLS